MTARTLRSDTKMLQLYPVGRWWIVLCLTVIGSLFTTVDLTELETGRMLTHTDESVSSYMESKPLADQHDVLMMCEGLGEQALRHILSSKSKYMAGHKTKYANDYTPANHINVDNERFSPFTNEMSIDDKMRRCSELGDEAIRRILRSESYDSSQHGARKINGNEQLTIGSPRGSPEYASDTGMDLAELQREKDQMFSHPFYHCRIPQRQSINVEDPDKLGRTLIPASAVVFTCRKDNGCCPPGKTCGMKTGEEIVLKFMALQKGNDGNFLTGVVAASFTNHTECKCHPKSKCPQRCPSTFRMRRRGNKCACECRSKGDDKMECQRIKNGDKALKRRDLNCIKKRRCAMPTCTFGQFNVDEGKCPKASV